MGSKPRTTPTERLLPPRPSLGAKDIQRAYALVVDDLGLSFESTARVRSALKKFVDEDMRRNDLVAVLTTGRGAAAFQQFTSDRRILHAAIGRLHGNLNSRVGGLSASRRIHSNRGRA